MTFFARAGCWFTETAAVGGKVIKYSEKNTNIEKTPNVRFTQIMIIQ